MVLEQLIIKIENKMKSLPHATHTSQIQVDLEWATQTLKLLEENAESIFLATAGRRS